MNAQSIFSMLEKSPLSSEWGIKDGFLRIRVRTLAAKTAEKFVVKLKELEDNQRIESIYDAKKNIGMEFGELYEGCTYKIVEDELMDAIYVEIHLKENSYGFNCISTRDVNFARLIDEEIVKMRREGESIS